MRADAFSHAMLRGLRSLVRAPSFSLAAVLTLGLGLGLAIAVFTVANALLLRRLPVVDQGRVVALWGEMRDHSLDNVPLGMSNARAFARSTHALQSVAFFSYEGSWPTSLRDGDRDLRLRRALVSGNFFHVLRTQPVLGRELRPSDDVVGAAPVIDISYAAWRGVFGGDAGVIGKHLTLRETGVTYVVVGVMPPGLEYPRQTDVWMPVVPITTVGDSTNVAVDLLGRLAPGATAASAAAELTAFMSQTGPSASAVNARGVARELSRVILGDVRPALFAFSMAAALLLLITCINVANLLLVRGLARAREMAVRSALGASRRQLIVPLLIESALLAVGGGVLGLVFATVAVDFLLSVAPADMPRLNDIHLDAPVLIGAVSMTAASMLIFGIAPAIATTRADAQEALRSGSRQSSTRISRRTREILVSAQIALAVLVLSAAALLGVSFLRLQRSDLAFEDSHLLIAELGIRYDHYDNTEKQLGLIRTVLTNVQALPGVSSVAPVLAVPFSGAGGWDGRATIDGQSADESAHNPMFNLEVVTPEYFEALGLRALRGRVLTDVDRAGAAPVVVVSEGMARGYWPNQDPIGKRLRTGRHLERTLTVVGVVPDTRYRDLREPRASVYFPLAQSMVAFTPTTLAIRTSGSPANLIAALRRVISGSAPGVVLSNAAPFDNYEATPLSQPRLNAFLLAVFALAALVLAAVGIFGALATMIRQRTRELGVRMALGATTRDVQSLVMQRGFVIAGSGVCMGFVAALASNRMLSSLLYEVSATDVPILAAVGALLLIVAGVATFIPARLSARISPAIALRSDG